MKSKLRLQLWTVLLLPGLLQLPILDAWAQQQPQAMTPQQVDSLTAPIALYPDALIAQILEASLNIPQLQGFAGWVNANSSLKGSALQDAAQKGGSGPPYVALAPFPKLCR